MPQGHCPASWHHYCKVAGTAWVPGGWRTEVTKGHCDSVVDLGEQIQAAGPGCTALPGHIGR